MRELQKLLVKGTKSDNPQAWDIRSTQVFIGPPTRRIEDARFVPMPPGRIGRLLVLLQMMSRGLLSQPLLSISPWFERRRPEYQDRLLGVSTKGDWDDWILFFCQDIEESCEDALLRVKRLVNVRQRYRSLLDEHRYSGLSVQTAMYLIGQPTVTASMLRRRFGKSPSAVQHALSRHSVRIRPEGATCISLRTSIRCLLHRSARRLTCRRH